MIGITLAELMSFNLKLKLAQLNYFLEDFCNDKNRTSLCLFGSYLHYNYMTDIETMFGEIQWVFI